jgi:hypothetical protein
MRKLKEVFASPPKGGDGHGVKTFNSMSNPTYTQEALPSPGAKKPRNALFEGRPANLRDTFVSGVLGARKGVDMSGDAEVGGLGDFRNFSRGDAPAQLVDDPSGVMLYDEEKRGEGVLSRGRALDTPPQPPGIKARVTPKLGPVPQDDMRADGRPVQPFRGI